MILLIDPLEARREQIADEVGADLSVQQVASLDALDSLLRERGPYLKAVVVGPDIPFDEALEAAGKAAALAPDVGVIVLTHEVATEDLRLAMRAGVLDVLDTSRTNGELRAAIDRSQARFAQLHEPEEAHTLGGRVVMVFSTKGGTGKSFIASNLAVLLAKRLGQDQVGLVDLDLQSGDLAIMFQLLPNWSLHDAAAHGLRLDGEAMHGFMTRHRSGIHLLAAPTDPAVSDQVSGDAVQHVLTLLRAIFPVTVVDCPAFFSDQTLAALDLCDEVVLVGSLDVPSVKNLKLALQTLAALKVTRGRIRIVLNRADSAVGLRLNEVEKTLGTQVDVALPSSREVPLSINQGTPLVIEAKKRSPVLAALERLADGVMASQQLTPAALRQPAPRPRKRAKEG